MIKKLLPDVRLVTEQAAIASSKWIGKKNEYEADKAAVNAMRSALNKLDITGTIVIGEGERDKAPLLFSGEKVGTSIGPKLDIAVDPLEGTTICAHGMRNSFSVLALSSSGNLLKSPDVYMDKIAVGPNMPEGVIDLDNSVLKNLSNIAKAKNLSISDLIIMVLNRPRHEELIAKIKEAGSQLKLINDGDIAAVIATGYGPHRIDAYMGIGGAPEGVLGACALSTFGGQIMGRLIFDNEEQKSKAKQCNISDFNKKYLMSDLVKGDVIFSLTAVTDGDLISGVKTKNGQILTESLVFFSKDKTINKVCSTHPENFL